MEHKVTKIKLSTEVAYHKIRSWCAYQERSHHDTRQKLFEFGLDAEDVEGLITKLIEENFLNEERFAVTYASGKFRIKRWGKYKIKEGLKQHRVSEYSIQKALKSIDVLEYEKTILGLISKKQDTLKESDSLKRDYIVLKYLVSRGFESDLIKEQLQYKNK